jgi:hypothetical protein
MLMEIELEGMISTATAVKLARENGTPVSRSGIVLALQRGQEGEESGIPGGVQPFGDGSQWLIPQVEFMSWLNRRRPRGPQLEK